MSTVVEGVDWIGQGRLTDRHACSRTDRQTNRLTDTDRMDPSINLLLCQRCGACRKRKKRGKVGGDGGV